MSGLTTDNSNVPRWIVRPMRQEDIGQCLEIWRKVELTEARQTVSSSLSADPSGFYVAENVDSNEIMGMCAAPMTRPDTAFVGFYAVDPIYQGIGIGKQLWSKTLGRLDASINIGLYGLPSMSDKYKRSGFAIEDSTRMLIFETDEMQTLHLNQLKDIDQLHDCRIEILDENTDDVVFQRLVDYDHSIQRFSRERFLRLYLRGKDLPLTYIVTRGARKSNVCRQSDQSHGTYIHSSERKSSCCARPVQEPISEEEALTTNIKGSLSISAGNLDELPEKLTCSSRESTQQNQMQSYDIVGYGCIRDDNNSGGMIGPIYADSSEICEVILKNLILNFKLTPGNKFTVMSLNSNENASEILTKIGLVEIDQCSRMFTKFVPKGSLSRIYYLDTPNFSLF